MVSKISFLLSTLLFAWTGTTALHAQDWSDLGHYQKDNVALGPPAVGEERVVFMGNSITIGWLRSRPEFFEGKAYINRGIGGQTTPQMLLRFRQDVIDLEPKVVVILAGTNDIAGNTGPMTLRTIAGNIASMAELARAHRIKVVLCSVLPAYEYTWRPEVRPVEKIMVLNKMLRTYAQINGIPFVDYFSAMADVRNGLPTDLAEDGVHPTVAGYQIMEPLLETAIADLLE